MQKLPMYLLIVSCGLSLLAWSAEGSADGVSNGPLNSAPVNGDDCSCAKLSCNPDCEYQTDLTFYSAKCDGGQRVKSCARPTCVPLQDAPAKCNSAQNASKAKANGAVATANSSVNTTRQPASVAATIPPVGKVTFLEAHGWDSHMNGTPAEISVGMPVYEKDQITTDRGGRVQVEFNSGNKLNITPGSVVVIDEASDSRPDMSKKRLLLNLIKGSIRSDVNRKYDGKQSYYRVRTSDAVAGVRGTIFITSVKEVDHKYVTQVQTLRGTVELSDLGHKKSVLIPKNTTAKCVADNADVLAHAGDANYIPKGVLTAAQSMTADQIAALEHDTSFDIPQDEASQSQNQLQNQPAGESTSEGASPSTVQTAELPVCNLPAAQYGQCSWTCEHNPPGEKKCRTDLPLVKCVRRFCDANGNWTSPTRLPASYSNECQGDLPVVGKCDY